MKTTKRKTDMMKLLESLRNAYQRQMEMKVEQVGYEMRARDLERDIARVENEKNDICNKIVKQL
jgi:hypothetical protein